MDITEEEAKVWYNNNGIAESPWDSFTEKQKGMLGIESFGDSWSEVVSMREVGLPESGVVLFFEAVSCGLDENRVREFAEEDNSVEQITPYVLQNTTSENLRLLFDDPDITVLNVSAEIASDGSKVILVSCEAKGDELFN